MAPMLEEGAQLIAVPGGVVLVSFFGLVFSVSAFAWICCQQRSKDSKSQNAPAAPPYKFVHMLKGVDIYPESLQGRKRFAASHDNKSHDHMSHDDDDAHKTDVNGNCRDTPSAMIDSRPPPIMRLDLADPDLNGNFSDNNKNTQNIRSSPDLSKTTQNHHPDVRSSPDLELPSPLSGFTQPAGRGLEEETPTSPPQAVEGGQKDGAALVVGTLHFSLEFQPERKAFVVHIKEAQGLTPMDEASLTSDPYIKLTLLPDRKRRVKTRVLRRTLDPAFDETFSFYGVASSRLHQMALHFSVLSFDRFSRDELIGETLVPLEGVDLTEGRVLMSRDILKKNVTKPTGRGELLLSLCYQSTNNTLTVVVLKARHLTTGPTDPYVKVNLFQGKKRVSKKKTHVKKCSPNPVFNELFVFDLPSDGTDGEGRGLADTSVELLLMDSAPSGPSPSGPSPSILGRLAMGVASPGTAGQHWREICEHPRRQIAKWHVMG